MHKRTAAILGSIALSAGLLLAQAPGTDQQQPSTPQTGQSAQAWHHRAAGPGMQVKMLTQKLNLSQDQVAQLTPIMADERQQMQALRAETSLTVQDWQAKAKAIRQDTKAKIEALLDDTQKQQYEKMLTAPRGRQWQHNGQQQPAQNQPAT